MPEQVGRTAVITVGTSMLSSASWRYQGTFASIPIAYKSWTESTLRDSPRERLQQDKRVRTEICKLLSATPGAAAEYFDWNPHQPLRYGAELTTLIRIAEHEEAAPDVAAGLRNRYSKTLIVCPADEEDDAAVAAGALEVILRDALKLGAVQRCPILIGNLSEQRKRFDRFLDDLSGPTDLVVTGGYKLFAMQAGFKLATRQGKGWALYYVHEDLHSDLVVHRYDARTRTLTTAVAPQRTLGE